MNDSVSKRWVNGLMVVVCLMLVVQVGILAPRVVSTFKGQHDWGVTYDKKGEQPRGNADKETLAKYDAYFMGAADQKVLYLTFDCGYELGYTPTILDALKKHNVHAAFFVVGYFQKQNPELVKRMVAEGHTVGNHTYNHPNMNSIATKSALEKELADNAALFHEITGQTMPRYYRPPAGVYTFTQLQYAKELGYKTMFWSLAYIDWKQDAQPSQQEAFQTIAARLHNGAVVLLHNTSKTNADILDQLLTQWEQAGYTFATLDALTASPGPSAPAALVP